MEKNKFRKLSKGAWVAVEIHDLKPGDIIRCATNGNTSFVVTSAPELQDKKTGYGIIAEPLEKMKMLKNKET